MVVMRSLGIPASHSGRCVTPWSTDVPSRQSIRGIGWPWAQEVPGGGIVTSIPETASDSGLHPCVVTDRDQSSSRIPRSASPKARLRRAVTACTCSGGQG